MPLQKFTVVVVLDGDYQASGHVLRVQVRDSKNIWAAAKRKARDQIAGTIPANGGHEIREYELEGLTEVATFKGWPEFA